MSDPHGHNDHGHDNDHGHGHGSAANVEIIAEGSATDHLLNGTACAALLVLLVFGFFMLSGRPAEVDGSKHEQPAEHSRS